MLGAVIAAAGRSVRMSGTDKLSVEIDGMPVLCRSVSAFVGVADSIVVTASDVEKTRATLDLHGLDLVKVVQGGATRMLSVWEGINALPDEVEYIAVHDGARPFVSGEDLLKVCEAAKEYGAAFLCTPQKETLHEVENGFSVGTPTRERLVAAKTPQVFKKDILKKAYMYAIEKGIELTDEVAAAELIGVSCRSVLGSEENIKITVPSDLERLKLPRVGHGFDVHRLTEGRRLVLGGVEIAYEKGLEGHSDADVLLHAITDAILGAACKGDIGRMFPDSDEQYRGISSLILLKRAVEAAGVRVLNIDATVVAQSPKLAPYIAQMEKNISQTVGCSRVNVKATTEERLGYTGRGEGISAHAVCTVI